MWVRQTRNTSSQLALATGTDYPLTIREMTNINFFKKAGTYFIVNNTFIKYGCCLRWNMIHGSYCKLIHYACPRSMNYQPVSVFKYMFLKYILDCINEKLWCSLFVLADRLMQWNIVYCVYCQFLHYVFKPVPFHSINSPSRIVSRGSAIKSRIHLFRHRFWQLIWI